MLAKPNKLNKTMKSASAQYVYLYIPVSNSQYCLNDGWLKERCVKDDTVNFRK